MTRDDVAGVVIAKVLAREGGIADVHDGKGVTRFGQTPAWLAEFGLPTPTTPAEASANLRTWIVRTRLIEVCDQADALADQVIDFAVHADHRRAIRALQAALLVDIDGVIGPETAAAIAKADRLKTARAMFALRLRYYGLLVSSMPAKYSEFAKGWLNRMADQVETLA